MKMIVQVVWLVSVLLACVCCSDIDTVHEKRDEVDVHVQNVLRLLEVANEKLAELRQAIDDADMESYVTEMRGIASDAPRKSELKSESKSTSQAFFRIQKQFNMIYTQSGGIRDGVDELRDEVVHGGDGDTKEGGGDAEDEDTKEGGGDAEDEDTKEGGGDTEDEDTKEGGGDAEDEDTKEGGVPPPAETPFHCNDPVLPEGYARHSLYTHVCTYPELQPMTFAMAEQYCAARHMRVTLIDGDTAFNVMSEYWGAYPDIAQWYIALTYNADAGEYDWGSQWRDTITYSAEHDGMWATDQPDLMQGSCVAADQNHGYRWVSVPCSLQIPVLCVEIATDYIPGDSL